MRRDGVINNVPNQGCLWSWNEAYIALWTGSAAEDAAKLETRQLTFQRARFSVSLLVLPGLQPFRLISTRTTGTSIRTSLCMQYALDGKSLIREASGDSL